MSFSKFSLTSALILALLLALTSTWFLSLRPVRLKIGDYYFSKRKFDQAANWYEKVVRKEKLRADQNVGDRSKYEEVVSKFEPFLIKKMESALFNTSQILGFRENRDLRSIWMDPKFFLKDINELLGPEPKGTLKNAGEELAIFDNLSKQYESHLGKSVNNRELEYLAQMRNLFKGIINEAENNFILADLTYEKIAASSPEISGSFNKRRTKIFPNVVDEYFYQTPLNWRKAKDFYENQVKQGKTSLNLFLNLAYIYTKFNNFSDSYKYFVQGYDLLKDTKIRKIIDHFRSKGIFLYPDDLEAIPKELAKQFPFLKEVSFFEAESLLNILGIKVVAKSNGFIGKTGMKSPVEIIVRSAGFPVGDYGHVLINGKNESQNKIGYNIVVLNPETGQVETSENFNTYQIKTDARRMGDFLNSIPNGKIVCVAVAHEASLALSKEEGDIFARIGAKDNLFGKFLWSHAIIGVKGAQKGEAPEQIGEKPVELFIIRNSQN
jgi:tetratricopeptide (TPR) repeat protein